MIKGHTIFDHAQLGHDRPTIRAKHRAPRARARVRPEAPPPQESPQEARKWFSDLGLGPRFR